MNKLVYILIIISFALAEPVSNDIALNVAKNTFIRYHQSKNIENFKIKNIDILSSDNIPLIYIFQLQPKGFIMISANNKATPVLAYGFESNFKLDQMPSNLSYIINYYKEGINSLRLSCSFLNENITETNIYTY